MRVTSDFRPRKAILSLSPESAAPIVDSASDWLKVISYWGNFRIQTYLVIFMLV
jgi:hypothetical protein